MPLKNFAALIVPVLLSYFYGMNLWLKTQNIQADYFINYWVIGAVIVTNLLLLLTVSARWLLLSNIVSVAIIYLCDLGWMSLQIGNGDFSNLLYHYALHAKWLYSLLSITLVASYCLRKLEKRSTNNIGSIALSISTIIALMILPIIVTHDHYTSRFGLNLIASSILIMIMLDGIKNITSESLNKLLQISARCTALAVAAQIVSMLIPLIINHSPPDQVLNISYVPPICALLALVFARNYYKRQLFNDLPATSGRFGTATWMSDKDYANSNMYKPENGVPVGADNKNRVLYLPIKNNLLIAPSGGGKTMQFIQTLLTDNRPMFVLDVKGELAATTARHRAETMQRKVVILDFFRVLEALGCDEKILLLIEYFNPFDFLSEDEKERSRMLNAFSEAFIVGGDTQSSRHFEENAKILIRGFIDFIMKTVTDPKERNLLLLFNLMSQDSDAAQHTFTRMQEAGGLAATAANQVLRVAKEERGSILSTSYRQIDWLSDANIQQGLLTSTFDLQDFLKGDTDIYFVLPADQVKQQSRLMRMLLALLRTMIINSNPATVTRKKMLFLLDELAQFEYCPDIEQFIELMRSYNVNVWAVFQSLQQIKIYKKADLFLGMPMKQFFTFDDVETMRWLQMLCGKDTILNKSHSTSTSNSQQKMQLYKGNISKSESENVQETGIDLLPINEIREMPADTQIIMQLGQKAIRCKKIRYYEHKNFRGKFDENPLEKYQAS